VQGEQKAAYDLLAELAAASGGKVQGVDGYDFTSTGGTADPYLLDKKAIENAGAAAALEAKLKAQLTAQQTQREAQFSSLMADLASSDPQVRAAAEARLGLPSGVRITADPGAFGYEAQKELLLKHLSKGKDLSYGDVASDAERKSWGELLKYLGAKGGLDMTDTDEGNFFSFDVDAYTQDVNDWYERHRDYYTPDKA
jgi:hypothetical protein